MPRLVHQASDFNSISCIIQFFPVSSRTGAGEIRRSLVRDDTSYYDHRRQKCPAIIGALKIYKVTLKNQLLKLMQMDEIFYKMEGMETQAVSGNAKLSGTGLRLSPTLLTIDDFSQGNEFKISCLEEEKIVLKQQ